MRRYTQFWVHSTDRPLEVFEPYYPCTLSEAIWQYLNLNPVPQGTTINLNLCPVV